MIPFIVKFTNTYCQNYELKCKQILNNNLLVTSYICLNLEKNGTET